ncbi:MAG: TonB-dependent receptor [Bacteroidota bacterium]
MFRKLLLVVVAVVLANGVFAQSGTLKGKVIDKATGEPIPFAAVQIVGRVGDIAIVGTQSDLDGNYTLKPIPAGKWILQASCVGYQPLTMEGVVVKADKIDMLDLSLSTKSEQIAEVQVIAYKIPLIDKDNTQTGETVTAEDIEKMPGRSVMQVASTVAGVASRDGNGVGNIRGARDNNTTFVDGIRVSTSDANSIPKSAQEQVQVITGGMSAKYGDVTGGVVSITTKNAASRLYGSVNLETSEFLDQSRNSLGNFTLSGPLVKVKTPSGTKRTLVGFFVSGDIKYDRNPTNRWYQLYRILPDVREALVATPVIPNTQGVIRYAANYLTWDDFEQVKFQDGYWHRSATVVPKVSINFNSNIDLTFGGSFDYSDGLGYSFANSLMNWQNNGRTYGYNWRAWARFTQRFSDKTLSQDEKSASTIKNAFYQIQAQVERSKYWSESQRHGADYWKYGYVGKFETSKIETYTYTDTISGYPNGVWAMDAFKDVLYKFTPSDMNPELSNVTSQYYNSYNDPTGHYENYTQVIGGGGIVNGGNLGNIYGIFNLPGQQTAGYNKSDNTTFRINASGSADIKNHEVSFGFEFEQADNRGWGVNGNQLWDLARKWTNFHIEGLDLDNPIAIYDANGVFMDTIKYNRQYQETTQATWDMNLRKHLGLAVDGTDWIDVFALDPSELDISYFSPDELLNSGASAVGYQGYDPYGNRLKNKPTFEDFFTAMDENGDYKREIGANQPIYAAGYIQDKFAFNDLIFNVGIRVDRYDLNQYVLQDPYSLYATKKVSDVPGSMNPGGSHPSNMGEDFVVYVDDVDDPSTINGYRSGDTWYNAYGIEVADPSTIASATGVAPYLVNPSQAQVKEITVDAFEDYTPQVVVMPRISFSFPISDEALFFAHYDILSSRPSENFSPTQYYYLANNPGATINNPNMKPEKTIDYELGFQQKLNNASSLKIAAYYREQRDMAQTIRVLGAYPVDYYTRGNIDFGTSKGLSVSYDLRRSGNLSLRANYTLGFSAATGSTQGQMENLLRTNQPNLRILSPTNWDQRHKFNISLDYRFSEGKNYNGPKLFGKVLLANSGANFTVVSGSGYPYSKTMGVGEPGLKGSLNGSRLPWTTVIKMRIDKDFNLSFKKNGNQDRRDLVLNVYLNVDNLLNTQNIAGVYSATGDPEDNGYLTAPKMQQVIATQYDEEAYRMFYQMALWNGAQYFAPRTMQIGLSLNF